MCSVRYNLYEITFSQNLEKKYQSTTAKKPDWSTSNIMSRCLQTNQLIKVIYMLSIEHEQQFGERYADVADKSAYSKYHW